jgi:hypothetical protein
VLVRIDAHLSTHEKRVQTALVKIFREVSVSSWASKDAAATTTWIDKLQAGDFRDRATYIFAYQISRKDPAGALTWVGSIQKEDSRNNLMVEVLRTWSERDLGAAKEWVSAQPDLPADVRANLPTLQPKR